VLRNYLGASGPYGLETNVNQSISQLNSKKQIRKYNTLLEAKSS